MNFEDIGKYVIQLAGILISIYFVTNRNRKEMEHRLTRIETLLENLPCEKDSCKLK